MTSPTAARQSNPDPAPLALSFVAPGQVVVIREVRGGQALRQRLLDLGLNHGARVRVIQNEMPGPMILAVRADGRLALGRGATHHVLVSPVDGGDQVAGE
jgi:ferrous iron transport protein A